ncbi:MAG: SDR family NAD(P)-dependent oxidoreductase [Ruminococcaceae bacterium]|nr:SDR family NAD(P)-dependent oxidoreductase [Oscillospiraceae bacterium]
MKPSVLMTGAYGGMGRATAKRLKDSGFRVFALDKTVGTEEEDILPIEADLTDESSVARAFEQVSSLTDTLFAVIHFAGIYCLDSLVEIDSAAFERIFKINLGGVFLVNKIFLPLLRDGSRIVITTSELAPLDPLPFTGLYAVTKSALDNYAYSLRMELQLRGIAVSVLRAGAVTTGMLGDSTEALDRFCCKTTLYTCHAERFQRIVNRIEARSIAPERIAEAVRRILRKRTPRFAYSINRNPLLLMLNLLPQCLQFWIMKQVLAQKHEKRKPEGAHPSNR